MRGRGNESERDLQTLGGDSDYLRRDIDRNDRKMIGLDMTIS